MTDVGAFILAASLVAIGGIGFSISLSIAAKIEFTDALIAVGLFAAGVGCVLASYLLGAR